MNDGLPGQYMARFIVEIVDPLSAQALALLRELLAANGRLAFVFPNRNGTGRVISENTLTKIIGAVGYKGRQPSHGFRGDGV